MESPVNNIDWCPFISTVFASCTKDGRIEIRDLNEFAQTAVITWERPKDWGQPPKTIPDKPTPVD